jgi:hypothetical protein
LVGDGRGESGEQQDKGASLLQRFTLLLFDLVLITIKLQSKQICQKLQKSLYRIACCNA